MVYSMRRGPRRRDRKNTRKKKTRELVTEKRTLYSWLNYYDWVTQATSRIIFVSYILNIFSKPPMIVISFYNQASSFSHALQIYCLGLLGWNPILFTVQAKTGAYNTHVKFCVNQILFTI